MDRTRIPVLLALLLLPLGGLQARLVQIQLADSTSYVGDINKKQSLQLAPARRGRVFDRNQAVLAEDRRSFDCYLVLEEYEKEPPPLARLLGRTPEEIRAEIEEIYEKIEKQVNRRPPNERRRLYLRERRTPYLLWRDIPFEAALAIETAPHLFPGTVVKESLKRHYPKGEVGCHLVGYLGRITAREAEFRSMLQDGTLYEGFLEVIGEDGVAQLYRRGAFHDELIGVSGIEREYNDALRGRSGLLVFTRDPATGTKGTVELLPARAGEDVELTIDVAFQEEVEKVLAAEALRQQKPYLAAVVLDPHTGEVLALASSVRYNPNAFIPPGDRQAVARVLADNAGKPLQSRAFAHQFQLGSIFKVVTSVAGLEEKKLGAAEMLACRGRFLENSRFFNCMIWRTHNGMHGELSLHKAMAVSCNCYYYEVGRRCGVAGLSRWAAALGLGAATDLDLPGEARGRLPDRPKWQNDELSLAIGQHELMVSPLQVAVMMAAVANGGNRVRPRLRRTAPPDVKPLGVAPTTVRELRSALYDVVDKEYGTAHRTELPKYRVAGKTSSAQVGQGDRSHAWFAGYAPHDEPRYVVVAFVEDGGHGSESAGPVASRIFELLSKRP